jgi:sugar lactone lactonase YvrE
MTRALHVKPLEEERPSAASSAGRAPRAATLEVHVALRCADELGEGPVWIEESGELLRVDITAGLVHRWSPATGAVTTTAVGDCVSAAIPRRSGGLVVALRHAVESWGSDGRHVLGVLEPERAANRCNDAACDAAGRLWVGTMSTRREPGTAALHRIRPGEPPEAVMRGTTISNGLGWSPEGDRMYFVDSPTQRVDVLAFDPDSGELGDRRPLIGIPAREGLPDGLAVDAEGAIWLCLFGGGQVRRYAPDGRLLAVAHLPASNPTSAAFGGADGMTLFVTSARHRLSPARRAAEPLAGAVFALRPGVRGVPTGCFAG